MRRKYILILIVHFICLLTVLPGGVIASPATGNSLTGSVKDYSGQPLIGAVVTIPDLKAGAVTDTAGFYKITNLPKGKYTVVVGMVSYGKVSIPLSIDGEVVHNFILLESAIESREVVITGHSRATEIR